MEFGDVATQWAAVTTHRFDTNAPPQLNFRDRKPDLMSAACHGCDANAVECPPTIRFDRVYSSPQAISFLVFFFCFLPRKYKIIVLIRIIEGFFSFFFVKSNLCEVIIIFFSPTILHYI